MLDWTTLPPESERMAQSHKAAACSGYIPIEQKVADDKYDS